MNFKIISIELMRLIDKILKNKILNWWNQINFNKFQIDEIEFISICIELMK